MFRTLQSLIVFLVSLLACVAHAQELDPEILTAEERAVTAEDVREALHEILVKEDGNAERARTAGDPAIPRRALELMLEPLTLDDLNDEIAAWFGLLRTAVEDLAALELALYDFIDEGVESADGSAAIVEPTPESKALVERIGALREVRTGYADRLRIVLSAFEAKGGDAEEIREIRAYLSAVGGVKVDTRNLGTAWLTLQEWVTAEDGGRRLLKRTGIVLGATLLGGALGWLLSVVVSLGLNRGRFSSQLMREFLRRWIARGGALVGLLLGLSAIGTNMTPILAGLGAVGFILAFALQDTIGNFASGMLILIQRPFDTGDEIEAAGVVGLVERVSLFSTHLSTVENRKVIVPNNMIWEDVIVNSTQAATRRLSIAVTVSSTAHSLEEAEEILLRVMCEHKDVLEDPAPDLTLSDVGIENMTFTCWPWVRTEERERLRRDLVARFGRELHMVQGSTRSGG